MSNNGRVLGQFIVLALVWGASFLFIKVDLEGLSPPQLVLGRLLAGAVTLIVVSLVGRHRPPRDRAVWGHLAVVSVLMSISPFLLFAWAEQHVPSGLASIYNATTPLMTILVALAALPGERPTRATLGGLALGFAGVLVLLGLGAGGSALGQAGCLLAALCYGISYVYLRKFIAPRGLSSITIATSQLCLAASIMLVLTPFVARSPVQLSWRVGLSIGTLGIAGTGLAYIWNTNLIQAWGATKASTVTYLIPVVGVLLGIVLLGERLSWNEPVGALLVIAGIALSQGRLRGRRKPVREPAAEHATAPGR